MNLRGKSYFESSPDDFIVYSVWELPRVNLENIFKEVRYAIVTTFGKPIIQLNVLVVLGKSMA